MLLLELLEAPEESFALAADQRDVGRLEAPSQLDPGGLDDRLRQDPGCDRPEDLVLDQVSRAAPGGTAERRAAVVAPLGPPRWTWASPRIFVPQAQWSSPRSG